MRWRPFGERFDGSDIFGAHVPAGCSDGRVWRLRGRCWLWCCLCGGRTVAGGGAAAAIPQDVETALHQISDRAAVIFVGQVTVVRRRDPGVVVVRWWLCLPMLPGSVSVPAQQASVDVVVGMLTAWQRVQHVVR